MCSRCIRICRDVVGANILGLINRGFETYVAPSGGTTLEYTDCESCGMCISACPTGAITENRSFKPGPVKLESGRVICNHCSVGCTLSLEEHKGYTWQVTGGEGRVNRDSNICRFGRFGYSYLNDPSRITSPIIRTKDGFKEISYDRAFDIIRERTGRADPDETAFFAGARLTNEEMYLIQKIARGGARTNNVASFSYLGRGEGYIHASENNTPFEELPKASRIYLIGSEISEENAVAGFMVNTARNKYNVPLTYISIDPRPTLERKADDLVIPESYFAFIKAVIHYLLSKNRQNTLFIKDHCSGFEEYRDRVLDEDYERWVSFSGLKKETIESFAEEYNKEQNAVIVFSEKNISGNEAFELRNLAMLTGKLGKTASGLICLKEKNNSQGIWDMGINPATSCGYLEMDDAVDRSSLSGKWKVQNLPSQINKNPVKLLSDGKLKNILIFGEDPAGCAIYPDEVVPWFESAEFIVVQDYFLSETAKMADIILPASLPMEIEGSFTNTQRVVQEFSPVKRSKLEMDSPQQLIRLASRFGLNGLDDSMDARAEALALISTRKPVNNFVFVHTLRDNFNKYFEESCDLVAMRFKKEFRNAFNKRMQLKN